MELGFGEIFAEPRGLSEAIRVDCQEVEGKSQRRCAELSRCPESRCRVDHTFDVSS